MLTVRSPDTSTPPTTAIGSPIVPRWGRPPRPIGVPDLSLLVPAASIREIVLIDNPSFIFREEMEWQLRRAPRHPRAMMLGEVLRPAQGSALDRDLQKLPGPPTYVQNFVKSHMKYQDFQFPLLDG